MPDTAEKYRDKVDPAHQLMMDTVLNAYHTMSIFSDHLDKVLDAERRAHSIGHITDPTMYRDMIHSETWDQQMRVMRAARRFIDDVSAIATELKQPI